MLSAKESRVMITVLALRGEKTSFLLSPDDILATGVGVEREELEKILENLCSDGYFDFILSDRKGEKVYCISLTEKGKGYLRSVKELKRNVLLRVCLTAALAVMSFVIGVVLKAIF